MLGLVLADDLITLYLFWELTTVFSYLLIGYSSEQKHSRRSALQALTVTTLGGLAMLVGFLILGQAAGSYRISAIVADPPATSLAISVAVVLILCGALSKSAIWPFSVWLPNAMAAPTPVSAYLHAAAMVKAGVYLVARLAPGFAEVPVWRPVVLVLGGATMLLGGWRALRLNDLKLVLAYGTVSQLGFLTLLAGIGNRDAALAAAVMILSHALFKAPLFLVTGIVDHAAGTRDLRRLSGVGRALPYVCAVAVLAAASMAALPPLLGFAAKEAAFDALLHGDAVDRWALAVTVAGSTLTVAYAVRFVWGAFARKPGVEDTPVHRVGWAFLAPPALLALCGLVLGPGVGRVYRLLSAYADEFPVPAHPYHLALWHGFGTALLLSAVATVGGVVLFAGRTTVTRLSRRIAWPTADRVFGRLLLGLERTSLEITGFVQRGSLSGYLAITLLVMLAGQLAVLGVDRPWHGASAPRLWDVPLQGAVAALTCAAALLCLTVSRRMKAVVLAGLTGYGTALLFVVQGGPDLALTQFCVETVSMVVFVLVLRRMPVHFQESVSTWRRAVRIPVALAAAATLSVVVWVAAAARTADPAGAAMVEETAHHGLKDVVATILVDLRAWDTMGESAVLAAAAIGVTSLIYLHRRADGSGLREEVPGRTAWSLTERGLTGLPHGDEGAPERSWLAAGATLAPEHRSVVFEVVARLLFHPILVLSVYLLFCAENMPGGGFVAGLVAGVGLITRYLAGGRFELAEAAPLQPGLFTGLGLFLSTGVALLGLAEEPCCTPGRITAGCPCSARTTWARRSSSTSACTCWCWAWCWTSCAHSEPRLTARSSGPRRRKPQRRMQRRRRRHPGEKRDREPRPRPEVPPDDGQRLASGHGRRAVRRRWHPHAHPPPHPHPARRGDRGQRHQPARPVRHRIGGQGAPPVRRPAVAGDRPAAAGHCSDCDRDHARHHGVPPRHGVPQPPVDRHRRGPRRPGGPAYRAARRGAGGAGRTARAVPVRFRTHGGGTRPVPGGTQTPPGPAPRRPRPPGPRPGRLRRPLARRAGRRPAGLRRSPYRRPCRRREPRRHRVNALVPLPVLLPLCATGLSLAFGTRLKQFQRIISVAVLTAVLALSVALMIAADSGGPLTVHLGDFAPPLGITLVADRLSGLMLTVSSAVTLCVLVYSLGQGMADRDEETPVAVFHPAYLILVGGVSCTFLAGDLVNLYVGFEIMLVASFVLLTLGGTGPRVRAGSTYVIISLFSSMLFLTAIAMTYAATGTANLAQLAQRLGELPLGVQTLIQAMLLTVFAIKAAVFPLAAWLPDSYPTAPAPVTAVFAGLLTKVGVYCMLRTETLLFPGNRLGDLLMAAALASMVIGILGAVAQTDLKRLLSFILISHIGYMVFGIGLASREAYGGAIVYVAHHITVQTTLFLVAGLIERRTGTTELTRIGGLARAAPVLAALFFVPAMNLAGIPPLSGFIGKLGLMRAGVADGGVWAWILVAGSVATSLLTLYVMAKVWNLAFWRAAPPGQAADGTVLESDDENDSDEDADEGPDRIPGTGDEPILHRHQPAGLAVAATLHGHAVTTTTKLPTLMTAATAAAVALGLSFTVLAGPLTSYTDRTAAELLARSPYIEAVLGR